MANALTLPIDRCLDAQGVAKSFGAVRALTDARLTWRGARSSR